MKWSLISLLIVQTSVAEKLSCTAKELSRLDCRITAGNYNIRLLPKTIAWNDGTWHSINEMPLKGEGLAWEKVQFQIFSNWPVLQLWIWDKSATETQVESLHWFVLAPNERKIKALGEGVVRRRRLEPADPEPPVPPTPPKNPRPVKVKAPKYIYDAPDAHALKPLKNGQLEWQWRGETKVLENPSKVR